MLRYKVGYGGLGVIRRDGTAEYCDPYLCPLEVCRNYSHIEAPFFLYKTRIASFGRQSLLIGLNITSYLLKRKPRSKLTPLPFKVYYFTALLTMLKKSKYITTFFALYKNL